MAKCEPESPAVQPDPLMEASVSSERTLKKALHRGQANKGAPGVDGMTVEQLPGLPAGALATASRASLLRGT